MGRSLQVGHDKLLTILVSSAPLLGTKGSITTIMSLLGRPPAGIAFTISNATGKLVIVAPRCHMGVLRCVLGSHN